MKFIFMTRTFFRDVPGFPTDCPCRVWCRGLTTCLIHVSPLFGNIVLNDSCLKSLTELVLFFYVFYFVYTFYIFTYIFMVSWYTNSLFLVWLISLFKSTYTYMNEHFYPGPLYSLSHRPSIGYFYHYDDADLFEGLKCLSDIFIFSRVGTYEVV